MATPPTTAMPYRPSTQTHVFIGATSIQITTLGKIISPPLSISYFPIVPYVGLRPCRPPPVHFSIYISFSFSEHFCETVGVTFDITSRCSLTANP